MLERTGSVAQLSGRCKLLFTWCLCPWCVTIFWIELFLCLCCFLCLHVQRQQSWNFSRNWPLSSAYAGNFLFNLYHFIYYLLWSLSLLSSCRACHARLKKKRKRKTSDCSASNQAYDENSSWRGALGNYTWGASIQQSVSLSVAHGMCAYTDLCYEENLTPCFGFFTGIGTFTCKSANLFQDDLEFLRNDPTLSQYLPWGSESSLADTLVLECIHNMLECVCTFVYNSHQSMHRCRKSVIVGW